jgi:hypothetical protein
MFRFTIRDLLWLIVVVALSTGWFTSIRYEQEKVRTIAVENEVLRKEKLT